MIRLNFPDFEFKLKKIVSKTFIFLFLIKKLFILKPELWVIKHVLNFLFVKKIPLSHIAVEKKININNLNKRFDVVVYNSIGDVLMLIECKSPSIKLTQEVFDQISVYNLNLNSNFCMITNGLDHIYFKIDQISKKYTFVKEFPLK